MSTNKPTISIVTPSYNQAAWLEQCLQSIHAQGYAALEHLVFDGGSQDDSVAVIKRHASALSHWESAPDGGQSAAINKGLQRATGDILCWVNSDDGLMPGALDYVARTLPDATPAWLVGSAVSQNARGRRVKYRMVDAVSLETFARYKEFWVPQPSVFWNRAMHERVGALDAGLNYIMDLDLFYRMFRQVTPIISEQVLSYYTVHHAAKTSAAGDAVDAEYAAWLEQRVTAGDMALADILRYYIELQRSHRTISEHVVLSRVVQWWKKYVNPRLYT